MTDWPESTLDRMIEAGTAVLGISVDPAWQESIRLNLRTTLLAGFLVAGFDLPDAADPAELFVP